MVIRHGEKPSGSGSAEGVDPAGRPDTHSLAPAGWARARALVGLFDPGRSQVRSGLARPVEIYAAGDSGGEGTRPRETVQPLADHLGLKEDTSFAKGDGSAMITHITSRPGPALISWQHEGIPAIAAAFGAVIPVPPSSWRDDRFDSLDLHRYRQRVGFRPGPPRWCSQETAQPPWGEDVRVIVLGWGMATALVSLVTLAAVVARLGQLESARTVLTAAVRASVQLAAVSFVIVAVVRSLVLAVAFVASMFVVASLTSARRMTTNWCAGVPAGLAICAGAIPVLVIVLVSGAVPAQGVAIVPIAGIVIGGAMSATSVAGRRAMDELNTRWGEYEAGLSLGLSQRDAAIEVCRPSAAQALTPPLDQTRTVGLVTLPGAFVGVLLGSGDPVRAGVAQLLVLVGLLAAETIAVLVTVELVARNRIPGRR